MRLQPLAEITSTDRTRASSDNVSWYRFEPKKKFEARNSEQPRFGMLGQRMKPPTTQTLVCIYCQGMPIIDRKSLNAYDALNISLRKGVLQYCWHSNPRSISHEFFRLYQFHGAFSCRCRTNARITIVDIVEGCNR